jgi:hypothetical protein
VHFALRLLQPATQIHLANQHLALQHATAAAATAAAAASGTPAGTGLLNSSVHAQLVCQVDAVCQSHSTIQSLFAVLAARAEATLYNMHQLACGKIAHHLNLSKQQRLLKSTATGNSSIGGIAEASQACYKAVQLAAATN